MRARPRSSIRTSDPQAVTFVELFFDLVFVFAVTQLTALTAHDLTPGGVLRSVVLGWLIWWAWTQFTWTLNPADTTHPAPIGRDAHGAMSWKRCRQHSDLTDRRLANL